MALEETGGALADAANKMFAASFGAVLKLSPEDGTPLWVDGRQSPPALCDKALDGVEADCQWRGGREALIRAIAGSRAFESAYASGRVTVSGDMSVMARLVLGEDK